MSNNPMDSVITFAGIPVKIYDWMEPGTIMLVGKPRIVEIRIASGELVLQFIDALNASAVVKNISPKAEL